MIMIKAMHAMMKEYNPVCYLYNKIVLHIHICLFYILYNRISSGRTKNLKVMLTSKSFHRPNVRYTLLAHSCVNCDGILKLLCFGFRFVFTRSLDIRYSGLCSTKQEYLIKRWIQFFESTYINKCVEPIK